MVAKSSKQPKPIERIQQPIDILILSNGPGEVATWVRPVVQALRHKMGDDRAQVRVSLVLSPCPNASGKEAEMARSFSGIDRVQSAEHFFPFLLWGKTAEQWDWRDRGVVVFLGGDQIYPVIISKRLGYRTVVYAEWETRWHRWIDAFGVMKPDLIDRVPQRYVEKLTVVGDLMAEVNSQVDENDCLNAPQIGLLPGSKPAKLMQGVPLALTIAQWVHAVRPDVRFVIPVAPTIDPQTLLRFADPQRNPIVSLFGDLTVELVEANPPYLQTSQGLRVALHTEFPAHKLLRQCCLCLTTVGANTAELAALGVPMIVLLPTQQLEAMRSWDGLPGLLANLPGAGTLFAKVINRLYLQQTRRLLAWPNIWAGKEIVPELMGKLDPKAVADRVLNYLDHPEQLDEMRSNLRQVRGPAGAAEKLTVLIQQQAEASFTQTSIDR